MSIFRCVSGLFMCRLPGTDCNKKWRTVIDTQCADFCLFFEFLRLQEHRHIKRVTVKGVCAADVFRGQLDPALNSVFVDYGIH